jgi:mono/diheme cytochrome c family protein
MGIEKIFSKKKHLHTDIPKSKIKLANNLMIFIFVGLYPATYLCAAGNEPQKLRTEVESRAGAETASEGEKYLSHVKLWLGKEASQGQLGPARGNERNFVLKGLKIAEVEAYDIQYQKKNIYRGINLRDLIGVMSPLPPAIDMLILHMDNGLLISVAVKDLIEDREIFLATEYQFDGKWTRDFMAVTNPKGQPVNFRGNKLIAGKQYQNADEISFNPWQYAGSLAGVEMVESRAYYRSMNRTDGRNTSLGHTIFQGRCWNCHHVRGVGGKLGPDLTGISELKNIKGIQKIFLRVAGPQKKKDPRLDHPMPYQKDFTFKDSKSLWFWLREIQSGDLAPYQPSYQKSINWEP